MEWVGKGERGEGVEKRGVEGSRGEGWGGVGEVRAVRMSSSMRAGLISLPSHSYGVAT